MSCRNHLGYPRAANHVHAVSDTPISLWCQKIARVHVCGGTSLFLQCLPFIVLLSQVQTVGEIVTLTHLQVKEAARAYRVYYTKTDDDPEDYLVDHSIIMYLLDPQARFMAFYGKNLDKAELSDKISKAIV